MVESPRSVVIKETEYIPSTFDIHYSTFAFSEFRCRFDRPFFAGGWADTWNL